MNWERHDLEKLKNENVELKEQLANVKAKAQHSDVTISKARLNWLNKTKLSYLLATRPNQMFWDKTNYNIKYTTTPKNFIKEQLEKGGFKALHRMITRLKKLGMEKGSESNIIKQILEIGKEKLTLTLTNRVSHQIGKFLRPITKAEFNERINQEIFKNAPKTWDKGRSYKALLKKKKPKKPLWNPNNTDKQGKS